MAARLWDAADATEGAIEVDGIGIATVNPEVLLSDCSMAFQDATLLLSDYSMAFQDATLFDDAVMENVRLGKHGATNEEARAAATAANCEVAELERRHGLMFSLHRR